ncbi:type IV pilus modification protein PilV [Deinobacterium chartae]|uniref:Type IV pilus modification protein PilV n=1 Tax=Deinobacterium chartae TaxID=521158 RepID=A0A841HZ86_9DEIO|nr:type IV pilus modification protein PilV [Deinobacterium chartae]
MIKRRSQGFTLIEVLIALTVFGIAMMAIIPMFVSNMQMNSDSELRTQGAHLAQDYIEALRLKDPGALAAETKTVNVGSRTFRIESEYCTKSSLCGSGSKHILVKVRHNNEIVFQTETVFTQLNTEISP